MGGGVSANMCGPALPSPGPESSSEQLPALERKLRCLEQEKTELSRKLQGTGEPAGAGWGGSDPGLATHLWVPPHPARRGPAGVLRPSGAGAATEGSADSTAQAVRYPAPHTTPSLPPPPDPSPQRLSCFPSTPVSNPGSSPGPTPWMRCDLREVP